MSVNSYEKAGVSIEKGDRFARFISSIKSPAIPGNLGGFAGGVELDVKDYSNPVLLSCTDGVGTKLLVAQELNSFDTVGIDLVAMCVNDLIVCGAKPISFLDYIACSSIDEQLLQQLVSGIVEGCEQSECLLSGGETAEMPDLYQKGDFDLAGFCTGIVEKEEMLPKKELMKSGDCILGIPSSGIHSNGFSLARKVIPKTEKNLWKKMLVPTIIYVKAMQPILNTKKVLGAAHITGGGLISNIQRSVPEDLRVSLSYNWNVPEIFTAIQDMGSISSEEMEKVFNMGIGMAVICHREDRAEIIDTAKSEGTALLEIGTLISEGKDK